MKKESIDRSYDSGRSLACITFYGSDPDLAE